MEQGTAGHSGEKIIAVLMRAAVFASAQGPEQQTKG
jgi:hypothetical protein